MNILKLSTNILRCNNNKCIKNTYFIRLNNFTTFIQVTRLTSLMIISIYNVLLISIQIHF